MRSTRAVGILVLVGLASCSSSAREEPLAKKPADAVTEVKPPPAAPPRQSAEAQETRREILAATPPSAFKLISAGSGAKRALRYAFKPGDVLSTNIEVSITSEGAGVLRGRSQDPKSGTTVSVDLDIRVEQVLASGDIVLSARVHPKATADVKAHARVGMPGTSIDQLDMRWTVSPRGFIVSGETKLPAATPDNLLGVVDRIHAALQELTPPLPEEPVGKGARFSVTRTISSGGMMKIDQEAKYTLKETGSDELPYEIALSQNAPKQDSLGVSFDSWKGSGKGRGTLHLTTPRFDHEETISQNIQMTLPVQAQVKAPSKVSVITTASVKARPSTLGLGPR